MPSFHLPVLRLLGTFGLCVLHATAAWAELPSVRFDRITPVGCAAGSSVEVSILGADLEDARRLIFDHPGLSAEFVKEKTFKISVAETVPAGTYDGRLVGRFGVSNPRLFEVTRGLTDVTEVEPNNTLDKAQPVSVNVAINGVSDGNGQDLFRFPARKGQRLILDCRSARLDTEMDSVISLSTATGTPIASNGDYYGRDSFLDFLAPADGEYIVEIRDLTYRGGYPYRFIISDRPHLENAFPRVVRAGETATLKLFGRNLPQGAPSKWQLSAAEPALDEAEFPWTAPVEPLASRNFLFADHPTHHSPVPTAATCTLDGVQLSPFDSTGVPMIVADGPVTLEAEPNDDQAHPQTIELPAWVSGRFDQPRDIDWYEFTTGNSAGQYGFDVYSERIAGRADPYLEVVDEKGNRVGELDDFGHRAGSFDGHLRDPNGNINLAANKKYRLLVRDRYGRGGARYQYVLHVRPPTPDFHGAAIHGTQQPTGLTLRRGGTGSLDVVVHQIDGYNGPMQFVAESLPPGVKLASSGVINNTRGTLVFEANRDAPTTVSSFQVFAMAKLGDQEVRRVVRPYTRVTQNEGGSRPTRDFVLSLLEEPTPFSLRPEPAEVSVEAGQKVEIKLQVTRHAESFRGAVNYQPKEFPGNFQLGNGTIAENQTEVSITISVQANTRPGKYSLVIQGQGQVPFNKDPQAKDRPNTLVTQVAPPLTVTVTEAKKK